MINNIMFLALLFVSVTPLNSCTCVQARENNSTKSVVEDMYSDYKKKAFASQKDLTPVQAWNMLQSDSKDVIIVDVREAKERDVSMIPGAISKEQFLERKDTYKNSTIISYCTIGYRSGLFSKELTESGFNAFNLAGSILSWSHAALPLLDSKGKPTKSVHVYGKQWNLLGPGYKGVF